MAPSTIDHLLPHPLHPAQSRQRADDLPLRVLPLPLIIPGLIGRVLTPGQLLPEPLRRPRLACFLVPHRQQVTPRHRVLQLYGLAHLDHGLEPTAEVILPGAPLLHLLSVILAQPEPILPASSAEPRACALESPAQNRAALLRDDRLC